MRVNVYAEEMTDRVEVISKTTEDGEFTGLRIYLELPCTIRRSATDMCGDPIGEPTPMNVRGPFIHRPGDDDSAAVTFWGKRDLRDMLLKAVAALDAHHAAKRAPGHKYPSSAEGIAAAAKAVRAHGTDYRHGTHAKELWKLVDNAIKESA